MGDTIDYKGCTIRIEQDEDAESPRDWDNLGTMLAKHPRYILGDRKRGDVEPSVEEIEAVMARKDVIWLPLYLLDHSGLWMKTSRFHEDSGGWDTSYVGCIYVTYDRIRKEYGKRITKKVREQVMQVLEGEVQTYSDYLEGNVVGFIAEGPDGEHIDSCWGFYPEEAPGKRRYDYMLSEAESAIDAWLKDRQAQDEQVRQLT